MNVGNDLKRVCGVSSHCVGVGERIVRGAPPTTRPKARSKTNLVWNRDQRLGLQGGEGIGLQDCEDIASGGICGVIVGDDAIADDVEIFIRGLVKESMHHDPGFGGIR